MARGNDGWPSSGRAELLLGHAVQEGRQHRHQAGEPLSGSAAELRAVEDGEGCHEDELEPPRVVRAIGLVRAQPRGLQLPAALRSLRGLGHHIRVEVVLGHHRRRLRALRRVAAARRLEGPRARVFSTASSLYDAPKGEAQAQGAP